LEFGIWNFPDKPGPFWLRLVRAVGQAKKMQKKVFFPCYFTCNMVKNNMAIKRFFPGAMPFLIWFGMVKADLMEV
jgi:hypothetical protein